MPIIGTAHVAYLPDRRVVGISKLARVVDVFAKRMQVQETLTAQIADTINDVLQLPPSDCCKMRVSFESRNGTCGLPSANALMTLARELSD